MKLLNLIKLIPTPVEIRKDKIKFQKVIECDIKYKKSEFDGKMLLKTTIEAQIEANISKVKKKKRDNYSKTYVSIYVEKVCLIHPYVV